MIHAITFKYFIVTEWSGDAWACRSLCCCHFIAVQHIAKGESMPSFAVQLGILFLQPMIDLLLCCAFKPADDKIHLRSCVVGACSVPIVQFLLIHVKGMRSDMHMVPRWSHVRIAISFSVPIAASAVGSAQIRLWITIILISLPFECHGFAASRM